uniref:guanylate cyclase n=1 Tax=Biomphalaria glabrata TaxID=6526 RepID=A0A2C9LBL4_BIOGL
MAGFLQDVMSHFGWTHIVFVTFNSRVWLETEAEILAELSDSALVTQTLNIDSSDWQNLTSQLHKVGANQYIFLLLMDGSDVLQLMKAANELKLMDGEHVFVSVDYSNLGKRVRNALSDAYVTGLMDITLDTTPESQVYKQFVQQIIINSTVAGSSDGSPVVLASLSTIGAVLLVSTLCGLIIWRVRLNRLESSLSWVIHIDDLRLKEKGLARSTTYLDNTNSSNMSGSSGSLASIFTESSYGQVFAEQYIYKNEEVASKKVILKGKQSFIITKEISKDVNHVIELTHANICKFYGICVDAGSEMSIWEYCRKGSLQDVIHNDKKYLDDMPFKISFMNDICKGLRYLHHSHLGRHGRLKASNVLVDNRWTCKLTHVMIPSLASVEVTDGDFTNHEGHLSTAPEVLRNPDLAIPGTKAADVYSFGIILLEIFTGDFFKVLQ